jgi:predicted transcriptional regulator of viral defense system
MQFAHLLEVVGGEPVFETGLLLAGDVDPLDVQRQLSRWVAAGRILKLRRGVYALAPPHRKALAHPFVVANAMARGSYVSREAALAHHGLIPEYAPVTTSVTLGRPFRVTTPLGGHDVRHVTRDLFFGYTLADVGGGQEAFVATPEKALLDLVHLRPGGDAPEHLRELRLQNLDTLDGRLLTAMAERTGKPRLQRAARTILEIAADERWEDA